MRQNAAKTSCRNNFLTTEDIPPEAHAYRLGTRSALAWIVNQYSVTKDYNEKTGRGSRIVNDSNHEEEPRSILDLIARVTTVSLETVKIIDSLLPL